MENFIHITPLWIELLSLAFCTGILAFFLWVLPAGDPDQDLRDRLWSFFLASVTAATASGISVFILRVSEMSGDTILSSLPLMPTVMLKTHAGQVWLVRIACLVGMLVLGKSKRHRDTRLMLVVLCCLDCVSALTESASGHAADKGDFTAAEIIDWIHLLGALGWAGGIFVLSFVLLPRATGVNGEALNILAGRVMRFSRLAGIFVFFIVVTALYNAVVYVGSLEALLRTSYGRTIAVKTALLFLLLVLAAYNRYVSVPNLGQAAELNTAKMNILARRINQGYSTLSLNRAGTATFIYFKHAVRIEAFLLLSLLFCAALLRHEIPARHAIHGDHNGGPAHKHMQH